MKQVASAALALVLAGMAATGHAEVVDKKGLTLDGAKRVIAAAVADARQKNAPGAAIAIVDDGGNLMALERLDNTFAAGANISIGKARTAALFKKPTKVFEDIVNKGRTTMVALSDFTPLQGGIPIIHEGQVIGGIGVSGAASAQQDEEIALAGASALTARATGSAGTQSSPAVTYIDSKKMAEAFSKGAVLIGNGEYMMHATRNYMVHASRRDAPGMAEIHNWETDVIYVLEGSATFVTGGTLVDPKTTEPGQIRGPSIQGGETRRLAKGDVIIIPNGVPHWFKEVQGPFLYFVVKPISPAGEGK
ncbi:MAG: heme-binding protein [Nitrospiraceae bacterium]